MKHRIVAVGKLRESYLKTGVEEYCRRLKPFGGVEVLEVAAEKTDPLASPEVAEECKRREGQRITRLLQPDDQVIALEVEGKKMASEKLAGLLSQWALSGTSAVTWVIGGHLGLAPEILQRAQIKLSLSSFTLPHQLARLILVEQLYRAAKINAGQPYHR